MKRDHTWTLIARKLTGESTPGDLKELEELLLRDKIIGEKFKVITEFWESREERAGANINTAYINLWQKIK